MAVEKKIAVLKNMILEDTKIISVSYESKALEINGVLLENLPPFYRVILCSRPGAGSEIHTEVWLPEEWNGIFLGLGNGGMAGMNRRCCVSGIKKILARAICSRSDIGEKTKPESLLPVKYLPKQEIIYARHVLRPHF